MDFLQAGGESKKKGEGKNILKVLELIQHAAGEWRHVVDTT